MAIASLWGLSNTDRKSAPRKSARAAISFSTIRNAIATETRAKITISEACVLFTALKRRYRTITTKIKKTAATNSLTMPNRKNITEPRMLFAVSLALSRYIKVLVIESDAKALSFRDD